MCALLAAKIVRRADHAKRRRARDTQRLQAATYHPAVDAGVVAEGLLLGACSANHPLRPVRAVVAVRVVTLPVSTCEQCETRHKRASAVARVHGKQTRNERASKPTEDGDEEQDEKDAMRRRDTHAPARRDMPSRSKGTAASDASCGSARKSPCSRAARPASAASGPARRWLPLNNKNNNKNNNNNNKNQNDGLIDQSELPGDVYHSQTHTQTRPQKKKARPLCARPCASRWRCRCASFS